MPLEQGDYSVVNFGTAFSVALERTWFVQPNFPGWLVLTGDESSGPGDRGIVFRYGVDGIMPALRSGSAGEAQPFDPRTFAENPPENIEVIESDAVEVGGASGFRVRFTFDEATDCAAQEICEYWLTTTTPFPPMSMRAGYQLSLIHI